MPPQDLVFKTQDDIPGSGRHRVDLQPSSGSLNHWKHVTVALASIDLINQVSSYLYFNHCPPILPQLHLLDCRQYFTVMDNLGHTVIVNPVLDHKSISILLLFPDNLRPIMQEIIHLYAASPVPPETV